MMQNIDHETNFRNRPQNRPQGSGEGRTCRPWVAKWGWVLIAAERLVVKRAGSETAILKERHWVEVWGITPEWLGREMDKHFPGFVRWLQSTPGGPKPLDDLKNRVYKMFYYGTSARGEAHDPQTRAATSPEHWRTKGYRHKWEKKIIYIIQRQLVCKTWKAWT